MNTKEVKKERLISKQKILTLLSSIKLFFVNVSSKTKNALGKGVNTLRKKIILYRYKLSQYLIFKINQGKRWIANFSGSFLFFVLLYSVFLLFLQRILSSQNINILSDQLYGMSFAIAGIIGSSIAIVFSFSTFILQSTADLFSTQYLHKFIDSRKEKIYFWVLVLLTIFSILIPVFFEHSVLEVLLMILFVAFCLIYDLYKELRKRINPESTLEKIKNDAIRKLESINKSLQKHTNIQNKVFGNEEEKVSLAVQYKINSNWNIQIIEDIKYLYEIGLRLLSKNEINSFNLNLKYIHDIYLQHLTHRSGHILIVPAGIWGTYTFEDEGFTSQILEYLESISNRLIQERRKENVIYLIKIYESIIKRSQETKFYNHGFSIGNENPLLNLIMAYYIGLIEKIITSKENELIWESIKSVSRVSNLITNQKYDHFVYSQVTQILNKLTVVCLAIKNESFLKEITKVYFNQVKISWDKHPHNEIFWKDLFKELKRNILALSISSDLNLSTSELFIYFHSWLVTVFNSVIKITDEEEKVKKLDLYTKLIEKWSDFLLDFARDIGLENKQVGLSIVQSVENNIRIIYGLKMNSDKDLSWLYQTQFSTLSWYFKGTKEIDSSHLFNLEQIQEFLLREINDNLKEKVFDSKIAIESYIDLVKGHFEKAAVGYGYNHPRIIIKLVSLGLIMSRYNLDVSELVKLIHELNKKYLELNKEYFELKQKQPNLMGPDEYQLCKEIYDLENDIFVNYGGIASIETLLKEEVTRDIWNQFTNQISYCHGITYKTVS